MNEITQSAYEADLKARFEEIAAAKAAKRDRWGDEQNRALLDAKDRLGLTFEEIASVFKETYGWGGDKAMSRQYKKLKAAKREMD